MKSFKAHLTTSHIRAGLMAACALTALAFAPPGARAADYQALPDLKWGESLPAAMSESKKIGKPILVDFYTDWCGWCKHLDETTYKDNHVKLLGDEFLWVRLDAERAGKDFGQI